MTLVWWVGTNSICTLKTQVVCCSEMLVPACKVWTFTINTAFVKRDWPKKHEKPQSVWLAMQLILKPADLWTRIITATPTCSSGKCYKFTHIHQQIEHIAKKHQQSCLYILLKKHEIYSKTDWCNAYQLLKITFTKYNHCVNTQCGFIFKITSNRNWWTYSEGSEFDLW
jgi:hypothetical protein